MAFDNSDNYVHSAPWSVADQGKRNVSHGCINISPSNAKWFCDNFGIGDPIVVTNSVRSYTQNDGARTGRSEQRRLLAVHPVQEHSDAQAQLLVLCLAVVFVGVKQPHLWPPLRSNSSARAVRRTANVIVHSFLLQQN
jgi:hypothetical protein